MRRVILKCKLSSRDRFEQKLADIDLDFSPIFWQHDRVYTPRGYKPHANYPRLIMRTEMKAVDRPPKYILLLRRHIEDSGVDVIESTEVKDYASAVNMILQLGFKPAGEVSRRRQALNMGDDTFIYLDKIDGKPGYYAKIEAPLTPDEPVATVRSDLEQTFKTLGEHNFCSKPYFELENPKN